MSVLSIGTPPFTDKDSVQRVIAALDGEPEGLQARFVINHDDGVKIVAVWDSLEDVQRFGKEKLGPALAQVMGEPTGTPKLETYDVLSSYIPSVASAG